ncbi:MAG: hypothetical protein GWP59_00555 [Chlamydiales bacterium]|nr:VTT domain-containing protein [Chlamydiales bacterium]NCF70167.1 hypothetical protein [Chlamydiales bacterium]
MEKKAIFIKLIPLIALLLSSYIAYLLGLDKLLSFQYIKQKHVTFASFITNYFIYSSLIYIALYVFIVATSFPGASMLSIFGGLLFPQPYSTIFTVLGASIGACILFVTAKHSWETISNHLSNNVLNKLEKGFNTNATQLLLSLRLAPVFPFWLVNLVAALFKVPFYTFAWTTAIGIIPGTFVFCQAGSALNSILHIKEEIQLTSILTFEMKLALATLALLNLLPVFFQKFKA